MDNSKNIPVQVKNRVAWTGWGGYIICGNTDYTVTFTFDEEWGEATAKTARFKFRTDEGMKYTDQPFTGNTVAVPMLSNIREVEVGVYVGDLNTTTGATIRCVPSILCGSGEQSEYEKKRFDELMQLFNDTLHGHENLKTLAKFACMAADLEQDDGLTILPDVVGVDRVSFWGNYLRYCGDGGVVKSVEEVEREGTKFLRLRFDMGPLVTNFDVPEFIDLPVALITERVEEVDGPGLVTNSTGLELDLGVGSTDGSGDIPDEIETDVNANHELWSQWNNRLAFGMNTASAPVPFSVKGQLFADGTIMSHNSGSQDKNRWGFHIYEGYAKDNYSRMTMLLDKHNSEANKKPSLEYYYYIGANHHATSYGNTKIGSDVAYHSFCFDRDKMTAYGEIDSKMPITLARISLANDIDTTYETVAAADTAYEPENNYAANIKCLKYIALKNAENGAMFYDTDRNKAVIKINGIWCDLPTETITDPSYAVLGQTGDNTEREDINSVDLWEQGVIGGDNANNDSQYRLRTISTIPSNVRTIEVNDGYEYAILCANSSGNTIQGKAYYDFDNGDFSTTGAVYSTNPINLDDVRAVVGEYCYFRLILRSTAGTEIPITVDEAVNLMMYN